MSLAVSVALNPNPLPARPPHTPTCSRCVRRESRYGTCGRRSVSAATTLPSADNEPLMAVISLMRSSPIRSGAPSQPLALVFQRSEPAWGRGGRSYVCISWLGRVELGWAAFPDRLPPATRAPSRYRSCAYPLSPLSPPTCGSYWTSALHHSVLHMNIYPLSYPPSPARSTKLSLERMTVPSAPPLGHCSTTSCRMAWLRLEAWFISVCRTARLRLPKGAGEVG